mmetsp:Transcript_1919/g.7164  ORF Transcript_1919/g.7164 Transcript_1919/m.7164 type:complete len:204 (+) Transcript_1919:556-1167(+)
MTTWMLLPVYVLLVCFSDGILDKYEDSLGVLGAKRPRRLGLVELVTALTHILGELGGDFWIGRERPRHFVTSHDKTHDVFLRYDIGISPATDPFLGVNTRGDPRLERDGVVFAPTRVNGRAFSQYCRDAIIIAQPAFCTQRLCDYRRTERHFTYELTWLARGNLDSVVAQYVAFGISRTNKDIYLARLDEKNLIRGAGTLPNE